MRRVSLLSAANRVRHMGGHPYCSRANEAWLKSMGWASRIHRKKLKGKPLSPRTAGANAKRSAVRACIEHVFAWQKDQMELSIL